MCWIVCKSKQWIWIVLFGTFFLTSCSETDEKQSSKSEKEKEEIKSLSESEKIVRWVESKLSINAQENYDLQILHGYLNSDTLKDALILVNRKEHAYQKAEGNKKLFERTAHTGYYNYVFVKLGGSEKLIATDAVGSNVDYPLAAEFLQLSSSSHQDFYVEFRVKNGLFRSYYTVRNNRLYKTFSCPIFDELGTDHPILYAIEHRESSVRISRDIVLKEGEIENYAPQKMKDVNQYTAEDVQAKDSIVAYFIFDNKSMKFITPMQPLDNE